MGKINVPVNITQTTVIDGSNPLCSKNRNTINGRIEGVFIQAHLDLNNNYSVRRIIGTNDWEDELVISVLGKKTIIVGGYHTLPECIMLITLNKRIVSVFYTENNQRAIWAKKTIDSIYYITESELIRASLHGSVVSSKRLTSNSSIYECIERNGYLYCLEKQNGNNYVFAKYDLNGAVIFRKYANFRHDYFDTLFCIDSNDERLILETDTQYFDIDYKNNVTAVKTKPDYKESDFLHSIFIVGGSVVKLPFFQNNGSTIYMYVEKVSPTILYNGYYVFIARVSTSEFEHNKQTTGALVFVDKNNIRNYEMRFVPYLYAHDPGLFVLPKKKIAFYNGFATLNFLSF